MLKRFANWWYVVAYHQTLWQRDELLKREWLEKGVERGRTQMRHGTIFDLYLSRADDDDTTRRAMQAQGGIMQDAPGVKRWRWWGVTSEDGAEVCLGALETMPITQAFNAYIAALPEDVRKLIRVLDAK